MSVPNKSLRLEFIISSELARAFESNVAESNILVY